MSYEEFATVTAKTKSTSSSGSPRPENEKTVVMVLTEKPKQLEKGLNIEFIAKKGERTEAMGKYPKVGVWCDVYSLKGYLMTPVAGITPVFTEGKDETGNKKDGSVTLNCQSYCPAGEIVEIFLTVDKNDSKIKRVEAGGVVVVEDVRLRAPSVKEGNDKTLPLSNGTNVNEKIRPYVPVANGTKNGILISTSPYDRVGYNHVGPNRYTDSKRFSYVGIGGIVSIPNKSSRQEGKPENSSPMMNFSNNGSMGVIIHPEYGDSLSSSEGAFEWAKDWESNLASEDKTATAGVIFQMFRKTLDQEGNPLSEQDTENHFKRLRANGINPQQSFLVMANNVKGEGDNWVPRTISQAIDDLVVFQGENVDKFKSRVADGTNLSTVASVPLRDFMDSGRWDIVCIPVRGWNIGNELRDNINKSGNDRITKNWKSYIEYKGDGRLTEKGNLVSYNPMMGYAEICAGAKGSFKAKEGETPTDTLFSTSFGVKSSYVEALATIDGSGHFLCDIRPMDKSEVATPLQWVLTKSTPASHVADIKEQIEALAVNGKAVQFGGRNKPAPVNDQENTTDSYRPQG